MIPHGALIGKRGILCHCTTLNMGNAAAQSVMQLLMFLVRKDAINFVFMTPQPSAFMDYILMMVQQYIEFSESVLHSDLTWQLHNARVP